MHDRTIAHPGTGKAEAFDAPAADAVVEGLRRDHRGRVVR